MIAYPFKRYDNCLYSEGSAVLILASEDVVKAFKKPPVWIKGIGALHGPCAWYWRGMKGVTIFSCFITPPTPSYLNPKNAIGKVVHSLNPAIHLISITFLL
jgi:hypothetical protein